MQLIVGKFYKIVFDVKGQALTFHCRIDEVDADFITFTDKYSKQLTYNKKTIISIEEVQNGN